MSTFDPQTLARWRGMDPEIVFREAREALYRGGAVSSAEFLEAFEELVAEGILTWEGIEALER